MLATNDTASAATDAPAATSADRRHGMAASAAAAAIATHEAVPIKLRNAKMRIPAAHTIPASTAGASARTAISRPAALARASSRQPASTTASPAADRTMPVGVFAYAYVNRRSGTATT